MPKISFLRLAVSSINSLQRDIRIYTHTYTHINRVLIVRMYHLVPLATCYDHYIVWEQLDQCGTRDNNDPIDIIDEWKLLN